MRRNAKLVKLINFFALFFTLLISIDAGALEYSITDLGTLGGSYSAALDINEFGDISGYSDIDSAFGEGHAFLYQNGRMVDVGFSNDSISEARGINANGQIVGDYRNGRSGDSYAFLYENGAAVNLGKLPAPYDGVAAAYAINDAGVVVGHANNYTGEPHAFMSRDGAMTDLGSLGGNRSVAFDINNQGTIVGFSTTPNNSLHAFAWNNDVMKDIGTLGGNLSVASGINSVGQITGYSNISSNGAYHAFIYDAGVMSDLGHLGGDSAWAEDINTYGEIVGESLLAGSQNSHAFLYHGGSMFDLNNFIPGNSGWTQIETAMAINDRGQIVGQGTINGAIHGYVMTPVPETDIATMLMTGLLGLFALRHVQSRRSS